MLLDQLIRLLSLLVHILQFRDRVLAQPLGSLLDLLVDFFLQSDHLMSNLVFLALQVKHGIFKLLNIVCSQFVVRVALHLSDDLEEAT